MNNTKKVINFIKNSPTCFHAVENLRRELLENGFEELVESQPWKLEKSKKYFTTRNNSSIMAFEIGDPENLSFNIVASHTDSPNFKLKENTEVSDDHYLRLNTEGYGGMIISTRLDRPLSIAGRVLIKDGDKIRTKLVNLNRDLAIIPNVAIHLNRSANDGFKFNLQDDMMPIISTEKASINSLVAKELGVNEEDIIGRDLFLYNRSEASIRGVNDEFFSSPQIDNLECCYTSFLGFLNSKESQATKVFSTFDNEEVGSGTKQGAKSTFIKDTLRRIAICLGKSEEEYLQALASSFLLSADNAHALHPNHPELYDKDNRVYMNEGVVVKSHAGQKYTSDGLSIAILKEIAEAAGVPLQFFSNKSDQAGGSTLGNLAMEQVSINAVDIGLAQLAMHSSYETAGTKDADYMVRLVEEYFSRKFELLDSKTIKVN